MKKLIEFAKIKNLETAATTLIDDDGNIEEVEGGAMDFFPSDEEDKFGIRPDGTSDGLDEPDSEFGLDDPFGESEPELTPEEPEPTQDGEDDISLDDTLSPNSENDETAEIDPDFQGVIRTVTGACLVYKRKNEDGTFEELWVHNVGKNMRGEVKIRRAILAGTDIPAQDVSSEDGTQSVETTTVGNVQFLRITGLPN